MVGAGDTLECWSELLASSVEISIAPLEIQHRDGSHVILPAVRLMDAGNDQREDDTLTGPRLEILY